MDSECNSSSEGGYNGEEDQEAEVVLDGNRRCGRSVQFVANCCLSHTSSCSGALSIISVVLLDNVIACIHGRGGGGEDAICGLQRVLVMTRSSQAALA